MGIIRKVDFNLLFRFSCVYVLLMLQPCFLLAQEKEAEKEKLETAIYEIIKAYSEKDAETINRYIHPNHGIYFLLNENNNRYWMHRQRLCLAKDCIADYNFPTLYRQKLLEQRLYLDYTIEHRKAGSQEDEGLFVDEENIHALTSVMRSQRQQNNLRANRSDLQKVWRVESNSKRVVLLKTDYDFWGGNFTFYLSYLNNNWYLSVIDFNN